MIDNTLNNMVIQQLRMLFWDQIISIPLRKESNLPAHVQRLWKPRDAAYQPP